MRSAINGTRSLSRVTNRKFIRGELSLVCNPSPILLGLAGFDGKLKFLGSTWEKILGYSPRELLGRPLCELMQHERSVALGFVDRLLDEESFEGLEFGLRCKDGTCKWFLWHRRIDSERQAIFIAGYDFTEQKVREIASILRSYDRPEKYEPGDATVGNKMNDSNVTAKLEGSPAACQA